MFIDYILDDCLCSYKGIIFEFYVYVFVKVKIKWYLLNLLILMNILEVYLRFLINFKELSGNFCKKLRIFYYRF